MMEKPEKITVKAANDKEKSPIIIEPGTEQETGLSRFIRKEPGSENEIKEAKLNNLTDDSEIESKTPKPKNIL